MPRVWIPLSLLVPAVLGGCDVLIGIEERVERACEGGAIRCEGERRLECVADGSREIESPCPGVAVCGGEGDCVPVECVEADGVPVADPTPGDCHARVCQAHVFAEVVDDADAPADGCGECMGGEVVPRAAALARGPAVNHMCVRTCDGRVACWGSNEAGQIARPLAPADGNATSFARWVELPGPATDLVVGFLHTCVALADGRVYCFGRNDEGQIDPGSTDTEIVVPRLVEELPGAVALGAGGMSTCAVLGDESIVCLGANDHGQLGDGTSTPSVTAKTVPTAPGVTAPPIAVTIGGTHACALHDDGSLVCWGEAGQTGNDLMFAGPVPPAKVIAFADVASVAAGDLHTCLARVDGSVWCFGGNGSGQAGPATFPETAWVPSLVPLPGFQARAVSGAWRHSCTIDEAAMYCWGDDGVSQLGDEPCPGEDGCAGAYSASAVTANVQGATDVATPWLQSFAIVDGRVLSWGDNNKLQLGQGSDRPANAIPTPIAWPPVSD